MFVYHLILHFVKKTEHDQHMSTLHCPGVGRLGAILIQVKALQGINKHSCDFTAAGLRCSLLAKELQVWHLWIISARSAAWCCVFAYSTHCKRESCVLWSSWPGLDMPSAFKRSLQDFPASITFRERLLMSLQVIKGIPQSSNKIFVKQAFLAKRKTKACPSSKAHR